MPNTSFITATQGYFDAHYAPHAQQQAFHTLGQSATQRLFLAGNRTGKTLAGAFEMAFHLTGIYPSWWHGARFKHPIHAWAASNTLETTRDILQHAYIGTPHHTEDAAETPYSGAALPPWAIEHVTHKAGVRGAADEITVRHASGKTSRLGLKSYDQGRAKFQGTARHVVHLDEEPDMDIYEECLLRTMKLSDNSQGHILLTMTPLLGLTDLVAHFQEKLPQAITTATWDDATHLNASEKERMKAALRPHEQEAREKGIPSLGSGKVYPVKEADILVKPFDIPTHFEQVFGMDFGWRNPTALVWAAYDRDQDIVYITDTFCATEQPPRFFADYIHERGKWIPGVCDPAGQAASQADGVALIDHYAEQGVFLNKADNGVESGIMAILDRLQTGRLKVFDTCHDWLKEFRTYRPDRQGRIVKQHDHIMDATRYIMTSGLSFARCQPASTPSPRGKKKDGWGL